MTSPLLDRVVPALALVLCVAGVGALFLPLVEAAGGIVRVSALDVAVFGPALLVGFVALAVLPVLDLLSARLRFTRWLGVPAVLALVPAVVFLVGGTGTLAWLAGSEPLLGLPAATTAGSGRTVLLVVEAGLLACAAAAIVLARQEPEPAPYVVEEPEPWVDPYAW